MNYPLFIDPPSDDLDGLFSMPSLKKLLFYSFISGLIGIIIMFFMWVANKAP